MAANSLIGNLAVLLSMDTSAFERGATHAQRLMARTQRQFQQLGDRISGIGQTMSVGITAPFTALMTQAIPAATESRQALGQVSAALRSMGAVSGRTAAQLQASAEQLQSISTFDDDDVLRKVTANLLTFGNVAGEQFDRAQLAIVNLSARMGTDLQSATVMVGRALNDPIRGMTALARSGIQFTEAQKAAVRQMVATGDAAGAQRIILAELERQFGGAAAAQRAATPGADVTDAWRNFQETVGEIALRVLPPLTNGLTRLLTTFNQLSPGTQTFVVGAVAVAAALGPILMVLGPVVSGMGSLLPLIVGAGGAASGAAVSFAGMGAALGPIAIAVAAVVIAFEKWDEISGLVQRVNQRLAETGTAADTARSRMDATTRAFADFSSQEAFEDSFGQALENFFVDLGRGIQDLDRDLNSLQTWVDETDAAIVAWARSSWQAFDQFNQRASAACQAFVRNVGEWFGNRISATFNGLRDKINAVGDAFYRLYDRVVGHSYVPDMVTEIGQHMSRLDALMVDPARRAAEGTAEAFRQAASETKALMDQLFPQVARARQMAATLDRIRTELPPELQASARRSLYLQNGAVDNVTPIAGLAQALPDLETAGVGAFTRMSDAVSDLGRDINGVLENGLKGLMRGFGSLKDIALNVLFSIGDALISNIFSSMAGAGKTGGIGGAIAGIFGSIFRASGGPVVGGKSYIVGERGPELFRAPGSGSIIPNHELGGGSGLVRVAIDLRDEMLTARIVQTSGQVVAAVEPRLTERAVQATIGELGRPRL